MMDPTLKEVVDDLAGVAAKVDARLLLVGAYARDLCLGTQEEARKTSDVDFAMQLESWAKVDAFFAESADTFRDPNRAELLLYHRVTGTKVDVVPCGRIESPPGTLALRDSTRRLNTAGLAECFELGRPLEPSGRILLPPPAGFIVLKLLAFTDRREHRDLRDVGHVLHRFPFDADEIWGDTAVMSAFEDGTLTHDDVRFWRAGCEIARCFTQQTIAQVVQALDKLRNETAALRVLVLDGSIERIDSSARLAKADRVLHVLRRAVTESVAAETDG